MKPLLTLVLLVFSITSNAFAQTDTIQSNIVLKLPDGSLPGTMLSPKISSCPIVLIIAGSGPTDRDGNSSLMKTDAYKLMAQELVKNGIASIRYDKRLSGKSTNTKKGIVFDDYVNDAIEWIKLIKSKHQFSKIVIAGHSEGSLIGILAAEKEPVDGFISLDGPAQSIDSIMAQQVRTANPYVYPMVKIRLDSLKQGYTLQNVPAPLLSIFGDQRYLKSWMQYMPAQEIKNLTIPLLILQGNTDIQVDVAEAKELAQTNQRAQLKIIDGMNHILRLASADRQQNISTYYKPELPLHADLIPTIVAFINSVI